MEIQGQARVSVVVPVYNSERTLRDCVQSILSQELTDIEVLLVDDGSKDLSGELCDELARSDNRVRVYHIQNSGPAAARNVGICHAKGQYIGFVDSDDVIERDMYRALYAAAAENDADVVMCNYNAVSTEGERRTVRARPCGVLKDSLAIKEQIIKRYFTGEMTGIPSLCNKLFKTELIHRYEIRIDETLIRAEDYWFNFEVLKKATCFVMIDGAYYNYRDVNPNSIMHHYLDNQFEAWKKNRQRLIEEGERLGFFLDVGMHNSFAYDVQVYILHLIRHKRKAEVRSIFEDEMYQTAIAKAELAAWCQLANRLVLKRHYRLAYRVYWIVERAKRILQKRV